MTRQQKLVQVGIGTLLALKLGHASPDKWAPEDHKAWLTWARTVSEGMIEEALYHADMMRNRIDKVK